MTKVLATLPGLARQLAGIAAHASERMAPMACLLAARAGLDAGPALAEHARKAVRLCPRLALRLER